MARGTDLVARIGGEEFAIVLPETDLAGPLAFAERARVGVERSIGFRQPMTISIGVASLDASTVSPSVLVRQGDARLYEARREGRNRVGSIVGSTGGERVDRVTAPYADTG